MKKEKLKIVMLNKKIYDLIKDLFNVFRVNDINNVDTDKLMIK